MIDSTLAGALKDGRQLKTDEAATMNIEDIAKELGVDLPSGLTNKEAERRKKLHGLNEIKGKEPDPLWKKYLGQFREPMVLLLLGSAVVSLCLQQFDDAISITVAIVIVCTVAFIQEYRSEKAIEALQELMPPKCYCLREGVVQNVFARDLVLGDVVILHMGDRVPADLRLFEAIDLCVDESSFTGEVEPVVKTVDPVTALNKRSITVSSLLHADRKSSTSSMSSLKSLNMSGQVASISTQRQTSTESERQQQTHTLVANMTYLGTLVRCGSGRGVVTATAANTEFGELFLMMMEEEAPRTPLQKSMDTLGKHLTICSFIIIGGIVVIGLIQQRKILETFTIAVSLAVAAIPEGLPIVVTVTLALGQIRMAKRKAIVKKLPAVETLGCVNVICSDKTGTLTKNEMTVTRVYTTDGHNIEVTGVGYFEDGEFWLEDRSLLLSADTCPPLRKLAEIGMVCNNATLEKGTLHGQPTEAALICLARKLLLHDLRNDYTRTLEIPFNSENKIMTVKCVLNEQNFPGDNCPVEEICFMKGALDRILRRCSHVWKDGQPQPLTSEVQARLLAVAANMGREGLRVLALARSVDGKPQVMACHGLVGILDPPRPGVEEAITQLQQGGVRICMVTGDAKETACAVGERLGIFHGMEYCWSGEEVENMSVEDMAKSIHNCAIFYRTTPKHKYKIIKAYQKRGFVVAMTGDGVNDAVALRSSDIGLAMGESGTDVCKEAADIVLVDDDFTTILAAIEEGKGIFYNIRNFIRFQMSTSISALSLVSLSTVFFLPNPLNAMQILWINILMDGPPAQSLGVETVDSDVIRQPPRAVNERILNRHLLGNIILSAIIITCGTLIVFYWEMNLDGRVTPRDTTMTFTCFVLFDMFNALSSRSQTKSIFTIGFTTNRFFLVAVTFSLIGQLLVIYFPPLQVVFKTEALYFSDILILLVFTSSIFWISELKKFIEKSDFDSTTFQFIRNKVLTMGEKFKIKRNDGPETAV